jgi:hypothetical protein
MKQLLEHIPHNKEEPLPRADAGSEGELGDE